MFFGSVEIAQEKSNRPGDNDGRDNLLAREPLLQEAITKDGAQGFLPQQNAILT
ncbi:MAG: hypothetical protein I8H77_19365 [Comamonadaceae bacterium]|nr:hypothetical protein [Comamonadaceae bacterium]